MAAPSSKGTAQAPSILLVEASATVPSKKHAGSAWAGSLWNRMSALNNIKAPGNCSWAMCNIYSHANIEVIPAVPSVHKYVPALNP